MGHEFSLALAKRSHNIDEVVRLDGYWSSLHLEGTADLRPKG
jgi:hypothetical protein